MQIYMFYEAYNNINNAATGPLNAGLPGETAAGHAHDHIDDEGYNQAHHHVDPDVLPKHLPRQVSRCLAECNGLKKIKVKSLSE